MNATIKKLIPLGLLAAMAMHAVSSSAAPLLFESFESYFRGELDANGAGSTNSTANNPLNPWAGPLPENCHIVGVETNNGIVITPHSGTNMVRGKLPAVPGGDLDQEYYNLQYWLNSANGNAPFMGNFYLDWWFYDEVGTGTNSYVASDYADYIAVCYYPDNPPNAPYDPNLATSGGNGTPSVRLSLGGTGNQLPVYDGTNAQSGWNSNVYQTRILGYPAGYTGTGWANLPIARSVGWHHAHIEVLPQRADTTYDAALYIDDMVHPLLTPNFVANDGFNCIEMNLNFGNVSAYFDDITFDVLPAPTLTATASGSRAVVTWAHSWVLQSSSSINPTAWSDVLDANSQYVTSPYTNVVAGGTNQFFRLRN